MDFIICISNIILVDVGIYYCVKFWKGSFDVEFKFGVGIEFFVCVKFFVFVVLGFIVRVIFEYIVSFICEFYGFFFKDIILKWFKNGNEFLDF